MVTSPTGKGVVIMGGSCHQFVGPRYSTKKILELSGNSIKSLKWNVLEQKLMYPRQGHLAFSVPDEFL